MAEQKRPNFILIDEEEEPKRDPLEPALHERDIHDWNDLLDVQSPLLMGILNVTPDSFSDGGKYDRLEAAIHQYHQLGAEGAILVDIGGESTRPGAGPVDVEAERERIIPIVRYAAEIGEPLSIDTRKAAVMREVLTFMAIYGTACVINDVSALTHDPESLAVVASSDALVILMHMKGEPATMNDDPHYDDVVAEVRDWLAARAEACIAAGIPAARIALDPGLGFGKTHDHNLALLHGLEQIVALGYPVCVGASRKLAKWTSAVSVRLAISTAAAVVAAQKGAKILRVHDVAETRAALRVAGLAAVD